MIRISTTALEAFRRMLTTEYGDEAELIAQIKGEPFQPSWQMQAGTVWDRCLSDASYMEWATSAPFNFDGWAVLKAREHIGPGVWQVKMSRRLLAEALGGWKDCDVVAQVDHIRGLVIQENKAKFSTPDARDYELSLQWRFYSWIFDAPQVRYNLFDFADPKGGYCELRNIVSFSFWTYPSIEADCRRWVREFLDWAASKNLLGYLNRASSTPVAA